MEIEQDFPRILNVHRHASLLLLSSFVKCDYYLNALDDAVDSGSY